MDGDQRRRRRKRRRRSVRMRNVWDEEDFVLLWGIKAFDWSDQ